MYVKAFAVAMMATAVLYGCKRSDGMEADHATPVSKNESQAARMAPGNVSVLNGWLRFSSKDDFTAVMKVLHDQFPNEKKLAAWETQYSKTGYTSLRRYYEQIDADTSENRRMPTVDSLITSNKLLDCPDSWFATVLSKDGFIQIADTVYSFKPGNKNGEAYAIPARHAGAILRGAAPTTLSGMKIHTTSFNVKIFPRWQDDLGIGGIGGGGTKIPGPTGLPICQYPSGTMPQWWGQVGGDIYRGNDGTLFPEHNGRQVKLNYHRWRVGYIFYASAGVRVKMWKHTRFAGWQSVTYAEEMLIEACCKGNVFIPGFPLQPFNEQTNPVWPQFARQTENSFEKTMKWTANGFFNEIILSHFNFHFRVNYRGRIAEYDIRQ